MGISQLCTEGVNVRINKINKNIIKKILVPIFVAQFMFSVEIANADFNKVDRNSILEVTGRGQLARKNGVNFRRHYKKNRAFGRDSELPLGSKLRYTGKWKPLKSGNFGIQVELLSGVEPDLIGKRVWIHYRNHKPKIAEVDDSKDQSVFNDADVTDAEDFIDQTEDPNEFFKLHKPGEDSVALKNSLNGLDETLNLQRVLGDRNNHCGTATCIQANERLPFSNDELNKQMDEAKLSRAAQQKILESGIPQTPLLRALQYFNSHKEDKKINLNRLIVADLTQSASKKRLYKIDLHTGQVLKFTTSHGRGYSNSKTCAHAFGNRSNSYLSSGGAYLTGKMRSFKGEHALTLIGAEKGKNNNAYSRGILFHRASYVSDSHAGRTLGCLSIADKYAEKFITEIQGFDGSSSKRDRQLGRVHRSEDHTEIYVYPDSDDMQDPNGYWDSQCRSELKKRGRQPLWIK
jgi:hypothetical protein